MSKPMIQIHNAATGETVVREMNDNEAKEHAEFQKRVAEQEAAEQAEMAAREAARESALAKLAALGLTEEEAAAIIK